jgi:hypothetical protein
MKLFDKLFGRSSEKLTAVEPFFKKNAQADFVKTGMLYKKGEKGFYFEVQMPGLEFSDLMSNIRIAMSMHSQLADASHYKAVWSNGPTLSRNHEGRLLDAYHIIQAKLPVDRPLVITVYSDAKMDTQDQIDIMNAMPGCLMSMGQVIDNASFKR